MSSLPRRKIADFSVEFLQILDKDGNCDSALMPKISAEQIKQMHKAMVLARTFDEKALKLQRSGRMGTYGSLFGQEAIQVGSGIAMDAKKDWTFPTYRENGVFIARGYPLDKLYLYWGGNEFGMQIPENFCGFPLCIVVGSQLLHAVGFAYAGMLLKKDVATIGYVGDGGSSEGDFHEALNFASVWQTPSIIILSNNQYAISTPNKKQTGSRTFAQKGIAYDVPSLQVDGNDVFAMYAATKEALERAHSGKGPTLIEAVTYRMGDHTTADDASRYRKAEEMEYWRQRDPISRLAKYMKAKGLLNDAEEKKIAEDCSKQIEDAVAKYEAAPNPEPIEMFRWHFKEMPAELQQQYEQMMKWLEEEK